MAVYKPSNFSPNLEEIDLTENNKFTCQVNTSGESVQAYKMSILNRHGDKVLFQPTTPTNKTVKNKGQLTIPYTYNSSTRKGKIGNDSVTSKYSEFPIENGKDFQWGVRVYTNTKRKNANSDAIINSAKPNTLVCEGFTVGSTRYVIWMKLDDHGEDGENKDIAGQLIYDRYIEFESKSPYDDIIIGYKDTETLKKPDKEKVNPKDKYVERQKIDWVTKELGRDKNFIKIETEKNFKYNYKDGTPFKIYKCSSEHTVHSAFADPNSNINISQYIIIYDSKSDADSAKSAGDTPANMSITPADCMKNSLDSTSYTARKMTGYSSDTGEIRVNEAFAQPPENGQCYRIFSYNSANKAYTAEDDDDLSKHIIGGQPISDDSFVVCSSVYDDGVITRLFMQPNINIKSDPTNPDEIVFENGARYYIKQVLDSDDDDKDITFDELDNIQWLLEGNLVRVSGTIPLDENGNIRPQTDYSVYTDFADTTPYNIFYARKEPNLEIKYRELYSNQSYRSFPDLEHYIELRDVTFHTDWPTDDIQVKYYKYYVYYVGSGEEELIAESTNIYTTELSWDFRGLDGAFTENTYRVDILIVDNYDKEFTAHSYFKVNYMEHTQEGIAPLIVNVDCNTHGVEVEVNTPLDAETTDGVNIINSYNPNEEEGWDYENKTTVDSDNINVDVISDSEQYYGVDIEEGQTLHYTDILANKNPLSFLPSTYLYSEFFINEDFMKEIAYNKETMVLSFKKEKPENAITEDMSDDEKFDTFTLTLTSFFPYYWDDNKNKIIENAYPHCFRLYKNGELCPTAFNGKSAYDILYDCPVYSSGYKTHYQSLRDPQYYSSPKALYMLQESSKYNTDAVDYNLIDVIVAHYETIDEVEQIVSISPTPSSFIEGTYYRMDSVDTLDYFNKHYGLANINDVGYYHYKNGNWEKDSETNTPIVYSEEEVMGKGAFLSNRAENFFSLTTTTNGYGSYSYNGNGGFTANINLKHPLPAGIGDNILTDEDWNEGIYYYAYTPSENKYWVSLDEQYYFYIGTVDEMPVGHDLDDMEVPIRCRPQTFWFKTNEVKLGGQTPLQSSMTTMIGGELVKGESGLYDDKSKQFADEILEVRNGVLIGKDNSTVYKADGDNKYNISEPLNKYESTNNIANMFGETKEWTDDVLNDRTTNYQVLDDNEAEEPEPITYTQDEIQTKLIEDKRLFWDDTTIVWRANSGNPDGHWEPEPTIWMEDWGILPDEDNNMINAISSLGMRQIAKRMIRCYLVVDNTQDYEMVKCYVAINREKGNNKGRSVH